MNITAALNELGNEAVSRWRRIGAALKDVFRSLETHAATMQASGSIEMDFRAFTDHELTSPFAQSLLRMFKDENAVKRVVEDYYIGQSIAGRAIFWYLDQDKILRTAHFVEFSPRNGRTDTDRPYWLHRELKEKGYLPQEWRRKRTLFGEHLLSRPENSGRKVGMVKDEQTCIVMAILYPQYVWLANPEESCARMDAVRGREVAILPQFDNRGKNFEALIERSREMNNKGFITDVVRWMPDVPIAGRVKTVSDWILGI